MEGFIGYCRKTRLELFDDSSLPCGQHAGASLKHLKL